MIKIPGAVHAVVVDEPAKNPIYTRKIDETGTLVHTEVSSEIEDGVINIRLKPEYDCRQPKVLLHVSDRFLEFCKNNQVKKIKFIGENTFDTVDIHFPNKESDLNGLTFEFENMEYVFFIFSEYKSRVSNLNVEFNGLLMICDDSIDPYYNKQRTQLDIDRMIKFVRFGSCNFNVGDIKLGLKYSKRYMFRFNNIFEDSCTMNTNLQYDQWDEFTKKHHRIATTKFGCDICTF